MNIHHQIIDFLKLTRRLSDQAGDRMLTLLIGMAWTCIEKVERRFQIKRQSVELCGA